MHSNPHFIMSTCWPCSQNIQLHKCNQTCHLSKYLSILRCRLLQHCNLTATEPTYHLTIRIFAVNIFTNRGGRFKQVHPGQKIMYTSLFRDHNQLKNNSSYLKVLRSVLLKLWPSYSYSVPRKVRVPRETCNFLRSIFPFL